MGWSHCNRAQSGASNHLIFLSAAQSLLSGQFDKVFVQWSALNRVWFFPGPDTRYSLNDEKRPDYQYRDFYISPREKKRLRDLVLMLNHDFHNILQLVDYCCILDTIAKQKQCDVYFINGIVPWTADIDNDNFDDLSASLSPYTKNILDFDNRDDTEVIAFLSELRSKFTMMPRHLWINLFDSMFDRQVDLGPLGHHPGIQSHRQTADMILNFLHTRQGTTYA